MLCEVVHNNWTTFPHTMPATLRWRHNWRAGVSNHQPHDCLLNCLFISQKTSKLCVNGLCVGNSPGTGEFPTQMASDAENVSISWRHHDATRFFTSLRQNESIPAGVIVWHCWLKSPFDHVMAYHQISIRHHLSQWWPSPVLASCQIYHK